MSTNTWLALGTSIATLVLLVVPVLVGAYYALESWIDDPQSYERVIAAVEASSRTR
jgi:hypothetical protein